MIHVPPHIEVDRIEGRWMRRRTEGSEVADDAEPADEFGNGRRKSAMNNGLWSVAQQGITTGANSLLAFLLILVLPVSQFGVYSYAITLVSIGTTVASGGLSTLAVRFLHDEPHRGGHVVAVLLITKEMFALAGYLVIVLVSLTSGTLETIAASLFAGLALFARAGDGPEIWYRARMRSAETALIRISVSVALLAVRLLIMWIYPNLWVFIFLFVTESVVIAVTIFLKFVRDRSAPRLGRPMRGHAVQMTRSSFPLLLSGLANQVNLRGDVVIIQTLMGATAVGVYSAAAKISELAYFLPVVFMNASFPILLEIRKKHGAESPIYLRYLQRSYDRAFWLGVVLMIVVAIAGTFVIDVFFGTEYELAKPVLWLSVVACPFVFMAAVYSKWIVAEGALWSSVVRNMTGAVANLALNLVLIPYFGIVGSAFATLVSYIMASYVACFFGKRTRIAAMHMSLAMITPARFVYGKLKRLEGP
ncbi:MAG: flippase [Microbacteriaceae bacterium]